MSKATMSVEEAAVYLGISRGSAYTAIRTGELPHIRIGSRILVPRTALETMLQPVAPTQSAQPVTQVS